MDLQKRINQLLEKGIDTEDAVGVRIVSVTRAAQDLTHGIYPFAFKSIPFFPYCDRCQYPLMRTISDRFKKYLSKDIAPSMIYTAQNQIQQNLEIYGPPSANIGSEEAVTLDLEDVTEIGDEEVLVNETSKRTGLSAREVRKMISNMKSRRGVQYSLSYRILDDFDVVDSDPHDCFLINFGDRLSVEYISGVKVYTDSELRELESELGLESLPDLVV